MCPAFGGLCQAVCPEAGERCRAGRVPVPLQPTREPRDLCTQEGQGGPPHQGVSEDRGEGRRERSERSCAPGQHPGSGTSLSAWKLTASTTT